MIRRAVLLFLASVSWVLPAFPQATYYLVDNSGSMTSYREGENGVDREVEGLIRGSPAGSEVYVQFFRGNAMTDCESPVSARRTCSGVGRFHAGSQKRRRQYVNRPCSFGALRN